MQTGQSLPNNYRGVFDLMNINEFSLSVPATVDRPLSCRAGADQPLPFCITSTDARLLIRDGDEGGLCVCVCVGGGGGGGRQESEGSIQTPSTGLRHLSFNRCRI